MQPTCLCGFGYTCPVHPPSNHRPELDTSRQSSSTSPFSFQSQTATDSALLNSNYSNAGTTTNVSGPFTSTLPLHNVVLGEKRPPSPAWFRPRSKQQNTSFVQYASSESSSSQQHSKTPQHAGAGMPNPAHTDTRHEGAQRIHAARATDCWYFVAGSHFSEQPSEDISAALHLSDQARVEKPSLELRKPLEPILRCTECLKFNKWKTWRNNKTGGVTKHIREHLLREHRVAYMAACSRIGYLPADIDVEELDENVREPLTPEGILQYIVEWFAEDDIPFNMVSHPAFRRFVTYIGQGKVTTKDIPDRRTVAAKAQNLSEAAKTRIKQEIKEAPGRVSCTADLWSDETQRSFMCITTHFYDKFNCMLHRLIGFCVIEGSHAGSRLADALFEVLDEFGVVEKLGMITLDNASNNDTLMAQLQMHMTARGLDFDQQGNRLRCFPHVINLSVRDILDALPDSAKAFCEAIAQSDLAISEEVNAYLQALETAPHDRLRRTVVALRHGRRRQGLQNAIREGNRGRIFQRPKLVGQVWTLETYEMKQLQLILDCPTRWSSTRNMIERFLELYQAVSRYIVSVPALAGYTVTHKDYEVLNDVLKVLDVAHQTQELLSSDKTPTLAFALPLYYALIDQWKELKKTMPALSHAIDAGIQKIEKYLVQARSSPAHIVAMALNPSIRYQWINQHCSEAEAASSRSVVKGYMLRRLEQQQREERERRRMSALSSRSISTAESTASRRLNNGYSAVLAAKMPIRPPPAFSLPITPTTPAPQSVSSEPPSPSPPTASTPSSPASSSSSSHISSVGSQESRTQAPVESIESMSDSDLARMKILNMATVELEHQKLEMEPVIPADKMGGLSAVDFWAVAVDILPAQASSVSSERVFSSSKMTCTQYRSLISAPIVEALQILKHSLRGRSTGRLSTGAQTMDFMAHHVDQTWGDAAISTVD